MSQSKVKVYKKNNFRRTLNCSVMVHVSECLVVFRMGFCTSVDLKFLNLRYSGARLTLHLPQEPQCSMGGERD